MLSDRKRHIDQPSESNTPTSPKEKSNKYDPKINSSMTDDDKCSSQLPKKSKFKHEIIPPTCQSCDNWFIMDFGKLKSPVMSMNCQHTICYSCVQHYVQKNQKKLNRSNINVCSCPIKSCGAKRSFNTQSCNFNEELILFYESMERENNNI